MRPTRAGARKNAPPSPPFVVEPAVANPAVSAVKELVSEPFVLPAAASRRRARPRPKPRPTRTPTRRAIELRVPARIDTANELTVGMTLTIKNAGGRPALLHLRRDNMMFDVDGPNGSAHCGQPAERAACRKIRSLRSPRGSSRRSDVWVGELCPDVVFDRPGLYRVRPSLAFPNSSAPSTVKVWAETVSSKEPVLVRVREGRLPFYTSPPQVFEATR